jgi:adenylate cyclase
MARELPSRRFDPRATSELAYGVCLATDAEGYTTLSEGMTPPTLAALLNEYFDTLFEPVTRSGGFIYEIIGDGLMCAWTLAHPQSMLRAAALGATLDAAAAIERFNRRHEPQRLPTRFGLNAGEIMIGNVGGRSHVSYSIIGDVANTSARIESLNKHLGTRVLASEAVMRDLGGFLARRVGRFQFVGKSQAIDVFEVFARQEDASAKQRRLCAQFARSLEALEEERWQEAADRLAEILSEYPDDGPTRFHLERCRRSYDQPGLSCRGAVVYMDIK